MFFVVLSSGLCRKLHLRNPLHLSALDVFDFSTVHELSSREQISAKKSYPSWESSPGPLGEKRERNLCATRPP